MDSKSYSTEAILDSELRFSGLSSNPVRGCSLTSSVAEDDDTFTVAATFSAGLDPASSFAIDSVASDAVPMLPTAFEVTAAVAVVSADDFIASFSEWTTESFASISLDESIGLLSSDDDVASLLVSESVHVGGMTFGDLSEISDDTIDGIEGLSLLLLMVVVFVLVDIESSPFILRDRYFLICIIVEGLLNELSSSHWGSKFSICSAGIRAVVVLLILAAEEVLDLAFDGGERESNGNTTASPIPTRRSVIFSHLEFP